MTEEDERSGVFVTAITDGAVASSGLTIGDQLVVRGVKDDH